MMKSKFAVLPPPSHYRSSHFAVSERREQHHFVFLDSSHALPSWSRWQRPTRKILVFEDTVTEVREPQAPTRLTAIIIVLVFLSLPTYIVPGGSGNGGGGHRMPPSWGPGASLSCRDWCGDILHWTIMTPLPPPQQAATLASVLQGEAKSLIRDIPPNALLVGGVVN